MSESFKEELRSVDQTSVTNEPIHEVTSAVDGDKVEIVDDVKTLQTNKPKDLRINNPQEKGISLNVTTQTTCSTTDVKDENVVEDKKCNAFPIVQETATNRDILSTKTSSSKDQNNPTIVIRQKECKEGSEDDYNDQMSESSKEELRFVDQTSITNEPIHEVKTAVEADKVEIKNNAETLLTNKPKDLPINNPQEKDISLNVTTQTTCSTTDVKDVKDEIVQEAATSRDILSTKSSSSKDQNNPTSVIRQEEAKKGLKDDHAENVTYTEDGEAIYTDPNTNYQYKWCTKENKWLNSDANTITNTYENEHYKWCDATQKWIPKQTQVTETEHYKWDADKNQWVAKIQEIETNTDLTNCSEIVYDIDEDGQRTYTDKDGVVFFWDDKKNAWFPKIDEDFMARYQMNYGFIDNTSESEKEKEKRELEASVQKEKEFAKMLEEAKANEAFSKEAANQGLKRKQPQEPPKWFEIDPAHNTKVYVSNLPLDITLDEFADVMGKCGMIMRDPQTQKYKIKLYTEADGQIKGDGLCDYIKVESVDLALKILDDYDLRGHKIRVQRAQFQMRGEYNPALKPKRKKKDKEKLAKIKEKLFDWRPEKMRGERSKNEKTVIIKNLFQPDLFEKDVQLILDYQNDLREECSKCGTVRKVVIYDRHSEGVAQVNMSTPEESDLVIQMMHGRFFGKRKLTAEHWDGKTKYKIDETEEDVQKRLNKWDQYLQAGDNTKDGLNEKEKEVLLTEPKQGLLGEVEN